MRILLVEDDALLGDGLQAGLTHLGFQLDWVRDGVEALNAVFSHDYAAVVLDLGVPRMDGLALLGRIRGGGSAVPVIILTARDTKRTSWPASMAVPTTTSSSRSISTNWRRGCGR